MTKNSNERGFQRSVHPVKSLSPCYYSKQYEFRQLNTSVLQSSQAYQRPVDPKHVRDIIDNFDPLYLDEILVSQRDGSYYVIDGQNRIAAFKTKNGGRDCLVNCKVFHGLSYEQEADMFYHLDAIKKKLRYSDCIRAKAEAKSDPTVTGITKILALYGLRWEFSGSGGHHERTVSASKALVECYETLGPVMFEQVARLLAFTWKGHRKSMSAAFIRGLALFVKTYAKDGNEKTFIRKVGALPPAEIKAMARAEMSAGSMDLKYARVFYQRYNYKTAAPGRLPYRLE